MKSLFIGCISNIIIWRRRNYQLHIIRVSSVPNRLPIECKLVLFISHHKINNCLLLTTGTKEQKKRNRWENGDSWIYWWRWCVRMFLNDAQNFIRNPTPIVMRSKKSLFQQKSQFKKSETVFPSGRCNRNDESNAHRFIILQIGSNYNAYLGDTEARDLFICISFCLLSF